MLKTLIFGDKIPNRKPCHRCCFILSPRLIRFPKRTPIVQPQNLQVRPRGTTIWFSNFHQGRNWVCLKSQDMGETKTQVLSWFSLSNGRKLRHPHSLRQTQITRKVLWLVPKLLMLVTSYVCWKNLQRSDLSPSKKRHHHPKKTNNLMVIVPLYHHYIPIVQPDGKRKRHPGPSNTWS